MAAQEGLSVWCSDSWTTSHSEVREPKEGVQEGPWCLGGAQTSGPDPGPSWQEDSATAAWKQARAPPFLPGPGTAEQYVVDR